MLFEIEVNLISWKKIYCKIGNVFLFKIFFNFGFCCLVEVGLLIGLIVFWLVVEIWFGRER